MSRAPWSEVLRSNVGMDHSCKHAHHTARRNRDIRHGQKGTQQRAADRDVYARASRAWSPPTDRKRAL